MKHLKTILFLVALDQITKLTVFFTMTLFEKVEIIPYFKIHYLLNPGFAMNHTISGEYGILFGNLIFLGIIAFLILTYIDFVKGKPTMNLIFYQYKHKKDYTNTPMTFSISMIVTGGLGNMIDKVFYGILLNNASKEAPFKFLHGQVIDMIHIDIWHGYIGSIYFTIFPIFNVADACLFVGAMMAIYCEYTAPRLK